MLTVDLMLFTLGALIRAIAPNDATLVAALHGAVPACIRDDGAQAVIIGGGPPGDAAAALAPQFDIPVIAPIPAAIQRVPRRERG